MFPVAHIETGEIHHIYSYEEILFMNFTKDMYYFHTFGGLYRRLQTSNEFYAALQKYGFDKIERKVLAQVSKITRYDAIGRIAYFEKDGYPTQACYVADDQAKRLKL
ncbi:hypothetical protein D3C72_245010 [compost metagenome]